MIELEALIKYVRAAYLKKEDIPQYHEQEALASILVYLTAYKQASIMLKRLAGPSALDELFSRALAWEREPERADLPAEPR